MAATTDLHEVEIEFETVDGAECEYEYKSTMLGEKAKIKRRSADGQKTKDKGDSAKTEVMRLVQAMNPQPGMRGDELIARTCEALNLEPARLRSMEVEVEFKSGGEIEGRI